MNLGWLGRHDAVQLRIFRETILERQNHIAVEQQSFTFAALRNIGELVRRNTQLLRQDFPVTGSLIEHVDVVTVLKDVFDLLTGQQILHVLRDTGWNAAPLPETLPDLNAVGGSLLFLQQK